MIQLKQLAHREANLYIHRIIWRSVYRTNYADSITAAQYQGNTLSIVTGTSVGH